MITYPEIPLAQTLVYLCKAKGISHIVISPGSRNAPLTLGFTSDPFFNTYSVVDERSAAFFAMGIAIERKQPVVVICTSGSALLNYYPAVCEAFYSDIPLVVISADRPAYRIDIGDGQTIRQDEIFHRHILYSVNLRQDIRKDQNPLLRDQDSLPLTLSTGKQPALLQREIQEYNEAHINIALNKAISEKGPVHLNAPFEEPLYKKSNVMTVAPRNEEVAPEAVILDAGQLLEMAEEWNRAAKKIILVGVLSPGSIEEKLLSRLIEDDSVVLLTETTSNLYHQRAFPSIDQLIAPVEKMPDAQQHWSAMKPDILLTFGGMVVSKKIKAFLRRYQPKHHWHVDPKKAYDTYFCLDKHLSATVNDFLAQFLPKVHPGKTGYFPLWDSMRKFREAAHADYLNKAPFSDMKAYEAIFNAIPNAYNLQLSNSSTVRYAQLFNLDPSLKVGCNRGTSGIDGSTSTAAGLALHSDSPTLLLTGDLSFFYDSNGLWNSALRNDFRIIVVNNGGGGIFRILPGDKNSEAYNTYFETQHSLNAGGLCDTFDLEYVKADDAEMLQIALKDFFNPSDKPKVLEVFTPREENDKVLLQYFTYLSENAD